MSDLGAPADSEKSMNQRASSPAHLWQLPAHPRRRGRPEVQDVAAGLLLVAGWFACAALMDAGSWGSPTALVIVLLATVIAGGVHFDVRAGWCSPLQLVVVPLWLLVPPAVLAPVVGLAVSVGVLLRRPWRSARPEVPWGSEAALRSAAAVGAAAVLAWRGVPEATPAQMGELLLIWGGQVLATVAWALGVAASRRRRRAWRAALWVCVVDGALLPVGFLVAYAIAAEPLAAAVLLPLVLLFAEFARERNARLMQAFELSSAYRGSAQLMATMLQDDHQYTGGAHTEGVVELSVQVGRELRLAEAQMHDLEFGALLHDIGKLHVPNDILNKPGSLTEEEWEIVRRHPAAGQAMLDRVGGALEQAGRIVRSHHERFDGRGYPDGLVGETIPIEARVITACDAWNAMTTDRAYRAAMPAARAAAELERCAGGQFDPVVVAALLRVLMRRGELAVPVARSGRWPSRAARTEFVVGGDSPLRAGR